MSTSVILFDLDETLIDDAAAVDFAFREACQLAAKRSGTGLDRCVEIARAESERLYRALPEHPIADAIGIASWESLSIYDNGQDAPVLAPLHAALPAFRRQAWERALSVLGIEDDGLATAMSERYVEARRRSHRLFPETVEVLEQLAGRVRLVMITNGASSLQREKVAAVGLERYFEHIVISGEVGVGKPEPAVFQHALGRVGAAPGDAAIVGDSVPRDIGGGAAAGVPAVWVNRQPATTAEPLPFPTIAQIRDLRELLPLFLGENASVRSM